MSEVEFPLLPRLVSITVLFYFTWIEKQQEEVPIIKQQTIIRYFNLGTHSRLILYNDVTISSPYR